MLYKKRLRDEKANETSIFTNNLHDALLAKNGGAFWHTWKSKFRSNASEIIQVDGIVDSTSIAKNFAEYFANICNPPSTTCSDKIKLEYMEIREQYCGSIVTQDCVFDIELVSTLICSMKNGKAAGLDELSCEHFKYCHPIVVCILTKLFNLFISSGHIPSSFCNSYTVPIPKCDGRTRALSLDDFRGISISPVVSKLFEMAILDRYSTYLTTSDCQFGFKKNVGCRDAIYCVRNVIESFVSNGSTVNACALDLSKAFDRMSHYALFIKLMERKIPTQLLIIIENWFNASFTRIHWNGATTPFFRLVAGVRQGGVLSPFLFALFIDSIVDRVKESDVGCYIRNVFCGLFLYADDILLLSPTVHGLQVMLNVCEHFLTEIGMSINVKKSACIRFGPRCNVKCAEIVSALGGSIQWVNSCRYLGIFMVSGRTFRCSFDNAKSRFFRAFNAIYSKVGRLASEEVILSLLRTKCLPILLYATEACPLLVRTKHSFEFALTRVFMKIFRTSSSPIVKDCQHYFNILPVQSQLMIRTAMFLQKFSASLNSMCAVFSLNARCQLNAIFSQFDHVTTASQLKITIQTLFANE